MLIYALFIAIKCRNGKVENTVLQKQPFLILICPDNKIQLSKESCVIHLTPSGLLPSIVCFCSDLSDFLSTHIFFSLYKV